MEPLYPAASPYSGEHIGATAAGESPPSVSAAAGGAPQRDLPGAAMVFPQQPQQAAASGGPAAFHSIYGRPVGVTGVVANMCALPAAAPSAFMPLQQQQLRSSKSASPGPGSTRYTLGAHPGTTGPGDVYYTSSFAPSTYPIQGSSPSLYHPPPYLVSALSQPTATAASATFPAGGPGPPSTSSLEDHKAQSRVALGEAANYGVAPASGTSCSAGSPPSTTGAADLSDRAAGSPVDTTPAADTRESVASLPGRVPVECLSAEDCGVLRQMRHMLQEGISNTFECITLLSGILLSHGTRPLIHHLVQAWEDAGQQQQSDEKMLCLLYVMNDALQKSRRRGCPFMLLLALEPLHRFCWKVGKQHGSILQSCTRVIRILRDAKAFGPPNQSCSGQIADALLAALQGNGTAALLPPAAAVQGVLEGSAEEASSETGAARTAQQQENTAGAESVEAKLERKKQLQRLLHAPPGGAGVEGGGRGSKVGVGLGGDGISQHLQQKVGGGVLATALLRGGSVFLQQARISSNMRTLPAAIDTFLLQYPVPGDEALATYIHEKFPENPQETSLRQQISDALGSLAAAQTALADKAVARRRLEDRLRELQDQQQRLRGRAECVQRAAAGGAQAQLQLWQQMQQQLQRGGGGVDFSPAGIAAEQERLANLVKAAHAKLRVLLKTEWNRRVELQGMLLSLAQAIEARLDVILPMHVHCREVKSVIDRASLLQVSRQQRKQRQERAEEELRQRQQQTRNPEQTQQQQQQGHDQLPQQGQEIQASGVHLSQKEQEEDVVGQGKGEDSGKKTTEQEKQQEEKELQHLQQVDERQEAVTHQSDKNSEEAHNEKSPQLSEQLQTSDPSESQAEQDQEQDMLVPQHVDKQHEGVSVFTEDAAQGGEAVCDTVVMTQQVSEQGDFEEEIGGLEEEPSFSASLNDEEAPPADEYYPEEQLLHEHTNRDAEQQEFELPHEGQPFEQQEEHDGWLV